MWRENIPPPVGRAPRSQRRLIRAFLRPRSPHHGCLHRPSVLGIKGQETHDGRFHVLRINFCGEEGNDEGPVSPSLGPCFSRTASAERGATPGVSHSSSSRRKTLGPSPGPKLIWISLTEYVDLWRR